MIRIVKGAPRRVGDKLVVMTSGGLGWEVLTSEQVKVRLAASEINEVELFTYTYLREDRFEIYGFETASDLALFELLITVSGLGPKTALAVFEKGSAGQIVEAIQNANLGFFSGVPRLGKKLAQKIVIELKGKLGSTKELDLSPKSQQYQDVKDSLLALGYAEELVTAVLENMTETVETADIGTSVRQALKQLTTGGK